MMPTIVRRFEPDGLLLDRASPIWLSEQEAGRRVLQRFKAVFDWAIVNGREREANPVDGVRLVLPHHRKGVENFPAIAWEETLEIMG
jgi:hypothetical protein